MGVSGEWWAGYGCVWECPVSGGPEQVVCGREVSTVIVFALAISEN